MREAKAKDYWRKIQKYEYKSYLTQIDIHGYNNLGKLELGKGIQVICGLNGAGKSTIILAIKNLLGIPLEKQDKIKIKNAYVTGQVYYKGNKYKCDNESKQLISQAGYEGGVGFLEYQNIDAIVRAIWKQENLDELLEQNETIDFQIQDIQQVNYLTGRNYTKISLIEVEDVEIQDAETIETFPFFIVEEGNISYDTREMGTGEYCLFYMYWYINKQEDQSIVLIEEPESFVAIKSQRNFMNFVAQQSVDKGISFVISTHSPYILENIENENIHIISRFLGDVVIKKPSMYGANVILGVEDEIRGTFLVEDALAKKFLEVIFEKERMVFLRKYNIEVAKDSSHITSVMEKDVLQNLKYKIIGVYDGDQKKENFDKNRLQYVFLPLVKDVETDMRSLLMSEGSYVKVAQLLGKNSEDVFEVLSGIAGLNHHDWWDEMCMMLGVNTHVMLYALYDVWKEKNQSEIQAFVNDLDNIVSG
ncbi:MAG: AAA family ATPase [Acetatifactor sp.]|nr:AAA family ATPase [Acetatifactor sp.]